VYRENGAVYLTKVDVLRSGRLLGDTIGHITMLPEESVKINIPYDLWLAERIASDWSPRLTPEQAARSVL
jgi:CMP-N-acetylneuraminic acid synthetase